MYDEFLQQMVQINFLPLCIIVFLIIFIGFNDVYEHEVTVMFVKPIFFLILLIVIDNFDYYMVNGGNASVLHKLITILGYNIRITLMLSLIFIEIRDESHRAKMLLHIPAFVNIVITFMALFTDLVFTYAENGDFVRGPLGLTPHVVSFIYSVILFVYGIHILKYDRWRETVVVCISTVLSLLGTGVETLFMLRGILIGVISLVVAFFYMFLHVEYFKRDILTGALNRVSFYADTKNLESKDMVAVFSIDLNDLKIINDTQGHSAGDDAIRGAAQVIRKNLIKGMHFYRIGGDEFVIVCIGIEKSIIESTEMKLRSDMILSTYKFAMGCAYMEDDEVFEDVYKRADREMYLNKRMMKGERRKNLQKPTSV